MLSQGDLLTELLEQNAGKGEPLTNAHCLGQSALQATALFYAS